MHMRKKSSRKTNLEIFKTSKSRLCRQGSNSVILSQISVLISEYLEVLGHFLAQPDRIQQKITKVQRKLGESLNIGHI